MKTFCEDFSRNDQTIKEYFGGMIGVENRKLLVTLQTARVCRIFGTKKSCRIVEGKVFKETVVLRRWGVLQDKLVLSTGWKM